MNRLKDIPTLARDGKNLNAVIEAVRETLQTFRGYRGDELDRALTPRDFMPGVLGGLTTGGIGPGSIYVIGSGGSGGAPYETDPTPPPTPTGLAVTAGISHLYVNCDVQTYTQGHGHDRTVVYGAKWELSDPTAPTFSEAVKLFEYEGTFSSYPSDPSTRWCIWIKWLSRDGYLSVDPAGGTNGAQATTGQDVSRLLTALTGQIRESQLYSTLGTRIDLIDAADTVAGSVAARVKVVNDSLTVTNGNVTTLSSQINHATTGLPATRALLLTDYTTSVGLTGALSSLETTLEAYADVAAAGAVSDAQVYTDSYAYSNTNGTTLAGNFSSLQTSVNHATTGLAATRSLLLTDYVSSSSLTTSLASLTTTLNAYADGAAGTAAADAVSTAQSYTNSYAYANSAGTTLAGTVSTISTAVNSPTTLNNPTYAAVQSEISTRTSLTDGLSAQWTVKLDVNGYVSGFGLASTSGGATPTSKFIVRTDTFAIASPTGPGITPAEPFIVQTVPTTINGVYIPAGVYMDAAFIYDLTASIARLGTAWIDNAMVANLSASKLTIGDGTVGGNLKSTSYTAGSGGTPGAGWLLTPGGNLYANNATVYGTIYATAGIMRGITIQAADGSTIINAGMSAAGTTFGGNVTGKVAGIAASTLVSDVANAADVADIAQADANTAIAAISNISSDNVLSKGEKSRVIIDLDGIAGELAGIDAQATAYGITTEKAAYDTAAYELGTYLNGLSPPWYETGSDTPIDGATFRFKFAAVHTTRQALLNKIAEVAGTRATWTSVASRPTTLTDLDATASTKLTGIQAGATVGAPSGTTVGSTAATTVEANASNGASAYTAVNDASTGLAQRLRANAQNVLAGPGGLATGSLTWDSSGVRTGGYGVGFTQHGIAAFNSAGVATFSLDGVTGDAAFSGNITGATGTFRGTVQVGASPSVSGTTMTGVGAVLNPAGTFAFGSSTKNISFNGTTMTANGVVFNSPQFDAFTASITGSWPNYGTSVSGGQSGYSYQWLITKENETGYASTSFTSGTNASSCTASVRALASFTGSGTVRITVLVRDANGRVSFDSVSHSYSV